MEILVFGNPLVQKDSLALHLTSQLREKFPAIEFIEFDSAENLEDQGRDLVILDVADGIKKVELIEDLSFLEKSPSYSMHDFDLALTLKLLKKMKKLDSIKIIAIPTSYDLKKAYNETVNVILSLSN
ncbi:hypothetical protein HY990_03945 [Candidatus Micrarchaeota archaeon]|nr:hypothetical protein [Candidatus Micrarchaeota archaeon]